jgi:serine/threonine protein kinase
VGPRIGAGGCGFIYQGTLGGSALVGAVPIACKEVFTATIDPDNLKDFQHEARMMSQLHHPFVVTFYGICKKIIPGYNGDPEPRLYMVTELATGGSLEARLEEMQLKRRARRMNMHPETKTGRTSVTDTTNTTDTTDTTIGFQCLEWALQIAAGMAHVHESGFIHRDLKPQNVLLNSQNQCLICDFGTVKKIKTSRWSGGQDLEDDATQFSPNIGMTHDIGTPLDLAPEQGLREEYTSAVDVWAFGVALVRMFSLDQPYDLEGLNARRLVMAVRSCCLRRTYNVQVLDTGQTS